MAVLAVCVLYYVNSDPNNSGKFQANISIAGIVPGNLVDEAVQMSDIDPSILAATLALDIETLVKNRLVSAHGYTFGALDTVRLVGALL